MERKGDLQNWEPFRGGPATEKVANDKPEVLNEKGLPWGRTHAPKAKK